jgi:TRAP-type C4-dicarboxylate transport system permease small subunit
MRTIHPIDREIPAARSWIGAIAGGLLLLAALALLVGCGAYSSGNITGGTPQPGSTVTGPAPAFAYLYSRIDYPLELELDADSTVRLTLSPQENLLVATPGAGSGVDTVGEPIPLPTRLQDYNDIGASVDTVSSGASPVVWQLVSPPRQSLLTPGDPESPRGYLDAVTFQWRVQAVATGQNLMRIILHLYYIYLDGTEHSGTIQMTSSPTPIIAVQSSIASTPLIAWLPAWLSGQMVAWRVPLAGLSGLAGLLGVFRFIWDLIQNAREAKEVAQGAAKAAAALHAHVSQRRPH